MSLADDLQTIESNPKYLSATPEQRTGILDKWKDAAANNYSAGDPSLKAALADEAESLLSANQARTRARLTPDVTGKFPTIVPSWGEVLANPTRPKWLLRDILEENVMALMAGPRGTYKSFIALHWAMLVARCQSFD